MKMIFDYKSSKSDHSKYSMAEKPVELADNLLRKNKLTIPNLSEGQVVRHFSELAVSNFSVDRNFYPLGSCTMKYNPKVTEKIASLDGFTAIHPMLGSFKETPKFYQGVCEVIYNLESLLCEIAGMDSFTLHPCAGAHGELTGVMIANAYHKNNNDLKRKKVIVPDSSHGTNPASAAVCGYDVVVIPSADNGCMDIKQYEEALDDQTAMVMLTCPNTLGIFNADVDKICKLAHDKGALVYYDGANLNAILGKVRPGDIGFDIVHLNLHKTFATPHGGGGPGSGPVGVTEKLKKFLPVPRIIKKGEEFLIESAEPLSIGYITSFYGNFLVALKAYAYILRQGKEGLISVSEVAVLNANYIKTKLKDYYKVSHDGLCMHECVFSIVENNDVSALDLAKHLIDNGIHPPTVYFPLTVREAFMVEPTETESKETLDKFIAVMIEATKLAEKDPQRLKDTPHKTKYKRFDETQAARKPILRWQKQVEG